MTFRNVGKPPKREGIFAALRRYGWLRLFDNFPAHPKWRVVAGRTGLPVHTVIAVAATLLCVANRGRPRGSLAEFSVDEAAVTLDSSPEDVARIYATLEELGWIDQEYLVTWDERQPDKEDPTAAIRQQRRREKLRKKRLSTNPQPRHAVTSVTPRDVTADQTRPDLEAERAKVGENLGTIAADPEVAQAVTAANSDWLLAEGCRVVAERMAEDEVRAGRRIADWLRKCHGDAAGLAAVIAGAEAQGYVGPRFHNLIVDGLRRLPLAAAPELPLMGLARTRRAGNDA